MSLNIRGNQIPYKKYENKKRIIKEPIKVLLIKNQCIDSIYCSKNQRNSKDEFKRNLSKILVIKLLKEEINLVYKYYFISAYKNWIEPFIGFNYWKILKKMIWY